MSTSEQAPGKVSSAFLWLTACVLMEIIVVWYPAYLDGRHPYDEGNLRLMSYVGLFFSILICALATGVLLAYWDLFGATRPRRQAVVLKTAGAFLLFLCSTPFIFFALFRK